MNIWKKLVAAIWSCHTDTAAENPKLFIAECTGAQTKSTCITRNSCCVTGKNNTSDVSEKLNTGDTTAVTAAARSAATGQRGRHGCFSSGDNARKSPTSQGDCTQNLTGDVNEVIPTAALPEAVGPAQSWVDIVKLAHMPDGVFLKDRFISHVHLGRNNRQCLIRALPSDKPWKVIGQTFGLSNSKRPNQIARGDTQAAMIGCVSLMN